MEVNTQKSRIRKAIEMFDFRLSKFDSFTLAYTLTKPASFIRDSSSIFSRLNKHSSQNQKAMVMSWTLQRGSSLETASVTLKESRAGWLAALHFVQNQLKAIKLSTYWIFFY